MPEDRYIRRVPCDDRGPDWSDTVVSQGTPSIVAATGSYEKAKKDIPSEQARSCDTLISDS